MRAAAHSLAILPSDASGRVCKVKMREKSVGILGLGAAAAIGNA